MKELCPGDVLQLAEAKQTLALLSLEFSSAWVWLAFPLVGVARQYGTLARRRERRSRGCGGRGHKSREVRAGAQRRGRLQAVWQQGHQAACHKVTASRHIGYTIY